RKVEPGMRYCAVRGAVEDGHQFLPEARRRGAAAALVEREQAVDLLQVLVRDGRRGAAVAAETWYGKPGAKLDLIGVTGTNGKTTSVTLARHVLSALEPMGSIGTIGAFDPAGERVPSEAGNLTTPGPIDLQATLAELVRRGGRVATAPPRAPPRHVRRARGRGHSAARHLGRVGVALRARDAYRRRLRAPPPVGALQRFERAQRRRVRLGTRSGRRDGRGPAVAGA